MTDASTPTPAPTPAPTSAPIPRERLAKPLSLASEGARDVLEVAAFAGHIVMATACCALIAGAAYVLGVGVHWLEEHGFPHWMTFILELLEYLLFVLDVATFVRYIARQTIRHMKS